VVKLPTQKRKILVKKLIIAYVFKQSPSFFWNPKVFRRASVGGSHGDESEDGLVAAVWRHVIL